MEDSITLKIREAYDDDILSGIARIDSKSMKLLVIKENDIIQIQGKRITAAKCRGLPQNEKEKNIIRIDGLIRNNTGTSIGDIVRIKKINTVPAERVTLTPHESIPPIDERYFSSVLNTIPLTINDDVVIPYFGGKIAFQVTDLTPPETVVVNQNTLFHLTKHGPTLV
jgi:transitional endoplasmic reticulum ATPase